MKYLLVILVLISLAAKADNEKAKCYWCEDGTEFDCMDSLLTTQCSEEKQSCVKIIEDGGKVKKGCMHVFYKPHYTDDTSCYRNGTQVTCPCNGDFCNSAKKNFSSEFFLIFSVIVGFALWH